MATDGIKVFTENAMAMQGGRGSGVRRRKDFLSFFFRVFAMMNGCLQLLPLTSLSCCLFLSFFNNHHFYVVCTFNKFL
jgi:hypothetical protein